MTWSWPAEANSWSSKPSARQRGRAHRPNWSCKCCGCSNWPTHKVCWTCGARRSSAEVAGSAELQPSPGTTLNKELASLPSALNAGHFSPPPTPPSTAGSQAQTSTVSSNNDPQEPTRQALTLRLQRNDQALAALPADEEWCSGQRAMLLARSEQLRKQISGTRSLGTRLHGCRSALERARARKAHADGIAQAAQAALCKAANEVVRLESELLELEQLVSTEQVRTQEDTCITRLQAEMPAVVAEMSASGNVSTGEVAATTQAMEPLFNGLMATQVSAAARLNAQAASPPQSEAGPPTAPVTPSVLQMLQSQRTTILQAVPQQPGSGMQPAMSGAATGAAPVSPQQMDFGEPVLVVGT